MSYFVINGAKVQRILRITDFFLRNMLFRMNILYLFGKMRSYIL